MSRQPPPNQRGAPGRPPTYARAPQMQRGVPPHQRGPQQPQQQPRRHIPQHPHHHNQYRTQQPGGYGNPRIPPPQQRGGPHRAYHRPVMSQPASKMARRQPPPITNNNQSYASTSVHQQRALKPKTPAANNRANHFFFTKSQIEETMGSDRESEITRESNWCVFIQETAKVLAMPQLTIATAVVFFHRFFVLNPKARRTHEKFVVATACLFLAGKVEETPKRLKSVLPQAHANHEWGVTGKKPHKKSAPLVENSDAYNTFRKKVLEAEIAVLKTIGFDLTVEHPYKHLLTAVKKIITKDTIGLKSSEAQAANAKVEEARKNLAQVAWNFVNDSLRTLVCLQYEPSAVAYAAIFMATSVVKMQLTSPVSSQQHWYEQLGIRIELLQKITSQLLELYTKDGVENPLLGLRAATKSGASNSSSSSNGGDKRKRVPDDNGAKQPSPPPPPPVGGHDTPTPPPPPPPTTDSDKNPTTNTTNNTNNTSRSGEAALPTGIAARAVRVAQQATSQPSPPAKAGDKRTMPTDIAGLPDASADVSRKAARVAGSTDVSGAPSQSLQVPQSTNTAQNPQHQQHSSQSQQRNRMQGSHFTQPHQNRRERSRSPGHNKRFTPY